MSRFRLSAACLALALAPAIARASPPAASFEALSRAAAEASDAGHAEEAIRLYREASALRGDWAEGSWHLGALLYERESWADAAEAFWRVVFREPDSGPAWAMLGLCEFRLGPHGYALVHLDRSLALGLADNRALLRAVQYHRAVLLTRAGRFHPAMEALKHLAQTTAAGPALVRASGLAALRLARLPDEVREDERELVDGMGAAMIAHFRGGRGGEALRLFDELARRHPATPWVHYNRGVHLFSLQQPDEGFAAMQREIEVVPACVLARQQIAHEHLKRGRAEQARPYAEEAQRLDPADFGGHYLLGQVRLAEGETEAAVRELEEATRLAPELPEPWFALARAYQQAGQGADAARARTEFRERDARRRVASSDPP